MRDTTIEVKNMRDLLPAELETVSGGAVIPVPEIRSDGMGGEYVYIHWIAISI
ncbi:MAG: hypothetical protein ACTHJS_01595 [Xanthobacteraceae bacterium]